MRHFYRHSTSLYKGNGRLYRYRLPFLPTLGGSRPAVGARRRDRTPVSRPIAQHRAIQTRMTGARVLRLAQVQLDDARTPTIARHFDHVPIARAPFEPARVRLTAGVVAPVGQVIVADLDEIGVPLGRHFAETPSRRRTRRRFAVFFFAVFFFVFAI
jgi:hypothetical protein